VQKECKKLKIIPFFCVATEIRCQEKSKGGLRYEVILAEPNLTQVQIPKVIQQKEQQNDDSKKTTTTTTPTANVAAAKTLSTQEIADKLKAAEERRLVCMKV
jgi:hypothetical protein